MTTSPTIATTLGAIVAAEPALARVSAHEGLSARAKYDIAKLARLVAEETRQFHAQRQELFRGFGVERSARPDEQHLGPTVWEVPHDQTASFNQGLRDLLAVDVTLPCRPVRSVDLPNATAADYLSLGPLCELVEPE